MNKELIVDNKAGMVLPIVDGMYISNEGSVQPNVLLRTAVFTPVAKSKINKCTSQDLTNELRTLEVCKKEGYDLVVLQGEKLNIETDFKVWCGVVLAFSKYGLNDNKITLKFTEFSKMCGFPTKRIDKPLRTRISLSLKRIQSQQLTLKCKDETKASYTGLLHKAFFDSSIDQVVLIADETLWDLYRIDRQVLISLKVLGKLPRAEIAQCLYLFFISLPQKPHPVSFKRLRERLCLSTSTKEANRSIKLGIEKLEGIGFISGSFVRKDSETYYLIDKRCKKLPN